jgi:excisionase family DNA binding protein
MLLFYKAASENGKAGSFMETGVTKTILKINDTDRELLTVQEIAALDRCSEKTVRRAIGAGMLQALRVGPGGRLLRITRQAHEVYRSAQRV